MEIKQKVKLFIHIGQSKTGSSAIQGYLNKNRQVFCEKYKLLYPNLSDADPCKGIEFNHQNLFLKTNLKNDSNQCRESISKCINYCYDHAIEKMVISWEGFNYDWYPGLLYYAINQLECDYSIILYLKRQDYWYESAWKQWGYQGQKYNSIQDYIKSINADWNMNMKEWLAWFKPCDFIIRPFEKNYIGNDVVKDFLTVIGIEDEPRVKAPMEKINYINTGFRPEILEILRICNPVIKDTKNSQINDFLSKSLSEYYKKTDPFSSYGLLSPTDRVEIIEKYEQSNAELCKTFFGSQRQNLFLDPLPDLSAPWETVSNLTLDKIIPVFVDILIKQQEQINSLRKSFNNANVVNNNKSEPESNWKIFLNKIRKKSSPWTF